MITFSRIPGMENIFCWTKHCQCSIEGVFILLMICYLSPIGRRGHHEKAIKLMSDLEKQTDLILTKQIWATGIVVAVKREVIF